jgi:hypothetical protein
MRAAHVAIAGALLLLGGCKSIGDSQKRLRTAVEGKQPTLDNCYAAALSKNAAAAGSMQVTLHVTEAGGRIDDVKIGRSAISDTELHGCVRDALIGLQITPAPKASLQVEYVLEFAPAEG